MSNLNTKIFVAAATLFAATGCLPGDEETTEGEAQEGLESPLSPLASCCVSGGRDTKN